MLLVTVLSACDKAPPRTLPASHSDTVQQDTSVGGTDDTVATDNAPEKDEHLDRDGTEELILPIR